MKGLKTLCVMLLACMLVPRILPAQEGGGGHGGRGGGGRPDWRNMSEEQRQQYREKMRQRYMTSLKEALKPANDEEWQILEMQIKQIGELRRAMSPRGFGRRGRRGGGGDESSPLQAIREQSRTVREELQALLKEESPSPEKLKAAMEKYRGVATQRREAEKKAREEAEQKRLHTEAQLKQAREELKSIITLRQEAVLLAYGILE